MAMYKVICIANNRGVQRIFNAKSQAPSIRSLSKLINQECHRPVIFEDVLYPENYINVASVYIHWPYCKNRCHFCNFNKYIETNVDHGRMKECLVTEVRTLVEESGVERIGSVFFGGGTPNLAQPRTIEAVLTTIADCADLAPGTEVTMEANPLDVNSYKLQDFKSAGINRISVGIQALSDSDLRLLGRDHSACDALKTFEMAKILFPGRNSVDIMYGLPNQTLETLASMLDQIISQLDEHVSIYQLTLERGTRLFKMVQNKEVILPDEDTLADMYDLIMEKLGSSGFQPYEISNFSRSKEARSVHNQAYWQGKQYIGIGPGAHGRYVPQNPIFSCDYSENLGNEIENGRMREARVQTLEPIPWMKEVERFGHGTRLRRQQRKREVLSELLSLGLRTSEGVTEENWKSLSIGFPTLSECFMKSSRLDWLFQTDLLKFSSNSLFAVYPRGWKLLDYILPHLLAELESILDKR